MGERPAVAMVGREESLGALRSALHRAGKGSPCLLLLTGETGVGKTRLVRELVAAESPTVLAGACVPMAGDPLPFAPLTQALRRLAGAGAVRQELARSPALARLVPGAATTDHPGGPAGASQLLLFQAVLDLLARLGAAGPVLHVVEDLHWADRATLDLLRFLAANLAAERALLLTTYRADAVLPGSHLAAWLADVGRLEITGRVALDRLGEQDTARLVADLAGESPDPEVLHAVVARSAGNPLFIEHLVLQGVTSGPLPATLHELLAVRVAALPHPSRAVLGAVAVLGRPASMPVLAATLAEDAQQVEVALRPALDQHVLTVRDGERIGFAHPAFGEVVYAGLLPSERVRLHRAAAVALEQQTERAPSKNRAGELARHWLRAGDLPRALDSAVAAGEAAERMFAFADAQASYARAAELTAEVPSEHDPVRLLARAADAASLVGDDAEAVRLGEAALARTQDRQVRASLCDRLGWFHFLAGRGAEAEQWFRQALALLPDGGQTVLAARVHAGLALFAAAWSRLEEAQAWGEGGLALALASGARREEGQLHNALGLVASARGYPDEGIGHLRRSLAIAKEGGDPHDLAAAYVNLSHVLGLAGRLEEVVATGRAGTAALSLVGLAQQTGSLLRANTGEALVSLGRLGEAATLLQATLELHPRGIMAAPALLQTARLAIISGDLDQAWDRCEQARGIIEAESAPDAWLREVHELSAAVEIWSGRPGAAYEQVIDGLHLISGTDEEGFGGLLAALGMRALADQAEAHRDPATRRRLADAAAPLDRAAAGGSVRAERAALTAWYAAERSRLSLHSDPDLWDGAAEQWQVLGQPFPAVYARWRAVEARLDHGVDAGTIAALRRTHADATALGAAAVAAELASLARWHRIDLPSRQVLDPAAGEPHPLAGYGLTERELEVLGGLAAGRTNREIAEELFISAKTASVHVSNILRKLQVSGRQEAARVAHRLGMRA